MTLDQKCEENPELLGLFDRIVRNVEQEASLKKIRYYASLTNSAVVGAVNDWRMDEKLSYARYLPDMTEVDFMILQMGEFHTAGQFGDVDGSVHGLFGEQTVTLSAIRTSLNPDVEVLRSNPTSGLPDGIVDAALNRLVNFGFLHRILPMYLSGEIKLNDPDVKFTITASGLRFHNWCLIEAS